MARSAAAARPARTAKPQPRRRAQPVVVQRQRQRLLRRRRLRLGLATIPLVALLFAGVVFVNSAELGITKTQGAVTRHTIEVQEQIASLRAEQAKRDSLVRGRAASLGLSRPLTEDLHFVTARRTVPGP